QVVSGGEIVGGGLRAVQPAGLNPGGESPARGAEDDHRDRADDGDADQVEDPDGHHRTHAAWTEQDAQEIAYAVGDPLRYAVDQVRRLMEGVVALHRHHVVQPL